MLVTTLTKRMAEDLTDYLAEHGVKVRYLHSDIDTVERVEIIRDLRLGEFDVLVGINLLREGLDMPEVSLVAILDADKEGFLRSERSLIQTIGRAARHINGKAILYADRMTDSMKRGDRRDRPPARQAGRVQPSRWASRRSASQKRIKDMIDGVYDADEAQQGAARRRRRRREYEAMPEKDLEQARSSSSRSRCSSRAQPRVREGGAAARPAGAAARAGLRRGGPRNVVPVRAGRRAARFRGRLSAGTPLKRN